MRESNGGRSGEGSLPASGRREAGGGRCRQALGLEHVAASHPGEKLAAPSHGAQITAGGIFPAGFFLPDDGIG